MSVQEKRVCQICGAILSPHDKFCPLCAFRGALTTDETAAGSAPAKASDRRLAHYEILTHEDGSMVELGRGAMGITYKAFDVVVTAFHQSPITHHFPPHPTQQYP